VNATDALAELGDRALAERVQLKGDEQAFRMLYRRHTPKLYQFALRVLGGNELDAEDVVQETWLRAVEGFREFRWEAALGTWLTGIALNLCRGLFRRHDRRWIAIREDLELVTAPRQEHEIIDLEAALTRLPPGYRTVVVLHDVEGFTHEQIAERLEISANTSKSQLSRGRRMLRSLLGPHESEQVRV
jgi:RNA polymerase sigma-70 factor (ECF subfamily)